MAQNELKHIAVILDGNGRWAAEHGLERAEGHRAGAERVVEFMSCISKFGIKYATLYAFSTENWKRSEEEVSTLMHLLCEFLDANIQVMLDNKIRLLVLGRMEQLPAECVERLKQTMEATGKTYEYTLILALNYGGRREIADAARNIARKVKAGELDPESVDEQEFARNLYLPGVPDPDLMIRTSGEERLSNFLLWQLSYAEFYFTPVYWPDFDENELKKAIDAFHGRKRRFGGRK